MKKYFYSTILMLAFTIANSQNIQVTRLAFTQTLFPKKKLPENVTNYNCTVTTPYLKDDSTFRKIAEDKYQKDLANYPNVLRQSEQDYDQMLQSEYAQAVKEAKEKYQLESDEFNKMTTIERLALIDKKPVLRIPSKPPYNRPPEPRIESINTENVIIFNPETLAKNYIKLKGFGENSNGLKIEIIFKGFEYIDPVAAVVDVENYNPQTREKFYTKQTQFVTKYRHPTNLKIKLNDQNLMDAVFQPTSELQILTTSSKPTRVHIEKQEVTKIMDQINSFLNDQYGYAKVMRNVTVYSVKNKKGEYDDIEKATNFATSGYKNYTEHQEESIKDLENAVEIWEKALSEVNYDDSKARIDEKVGTAILKNLIFATIIISDFEKADKYISDFKTLRLDYENKQLVDQYENLKNDLKSRFNG
ncbi:MAG TPA: hypothetical protein VIV55_10445 [Flavobacterium sp.]